MGNALDLYVEGRKGIRDLDIPIPNKETYAALTSYIIEGVLADLQEGNIKMVVDTADRLRAMETYIAAKRKQQEADLIAQNMMAALRLRTIREIGKWLQENIDHNPGRPVEESRQSAQITWDGVGIDSRTGHRWEDAALIPDDKFEEFLAPYLSRDNESEELHLSDLLRLAQSPREIFESTPPVSVPVSLSGSEREVYIKCVELAETIDSWTQQLAKGETPRTRFLVVAEALRLCAEKIVDTLQKNGELY